MGRVTAGVTVTHADGCYRVTTAGGVPDDGARVHPPATATSRGIPTGTGDGRGGVVVAAAAPRAGRGAVAADASAIGDRARSGSVIGADG